MWKLTERVLLLIIKKKKLRRSPPTHNPLKDEQAPLDKYLGLARSLSDLISERYRCCLNPPPSNNAILQVSRVFVTGVFATRKLSDKTHQNPFQHNFTKQLNQWPGQPMTVRARHATAYCPRLQSSCGGLSYTLLCCSYCLTRDAALTIFKVMLKWSILHCRNS